MPPPLQIQPPAPQPAGHPGGGAWMLQFDGTWRWQPGATPDPHLVSQWGQGAITDVHRDPAGNVGPGSWYPVHGGGWEWQWGRDPDPRWQHSYGHDALTNPNRTPNGAIGPGDPKSPEHPPPPDVNPPDITDTWHGTAPSVTGAPPLDDDGGKGSGETVSEPPYHAAYMVSPGGIRNTENNLLAHIDTQISNYNSLKSHVAQARGQNLYMMGASVQQLGNVQDALLLQIGDVVTLVGQFTRMLNNAAQGYARADIDSYLPET